MKNNLILICWTLLCISLSGLAHSQTINVSSKITIETAIINAKNYAKNKKINLSSKFIVKVEYHHNTHNKNKLSYWVVHWSEKKLSKGGVFELKLYEDGSIKELHYK